MGWGGGGVGWGGVGWGGVGWGGQEARQGAGGTYARCAVNGRLAAHGGRRHAGMRAGLVPPHRWTWPAGLLQVCKHARTGTGTHVPRFGNEGGSMHKGTKGNNRQQQQAQALTSPGLVRGVVDEHVVHPVLVGVEVAHLHIFLSWKTVEKGESSGKQWKAVESSGNARLSGRLHSAFHDARDARQWHQRRDAQRAAPPCLPPLTSWSLSHTFMRCRTPVSHASCTSGQC